VNGRADVIITGEKDLLELHPFRGVVIVSPATTCGADGFSARRRPIAIWAESSSTSVSLRRHTHREASG